MEDHLPEERFTRHRLSGRVRSSAGYTIRRRHFAIEYTDQLGSVSIDAEWQPGRGEWMTVCRAGIPDTPERRADDVIDNLRRAFGAVGWHLSIRRDDGSQ